MRARNLRDKAKKMALINCSECGAQVSDKAAACPQCGNPIGLAAARPIERSSGSRVVSGAASTYRWVTWVGIAVFLFVVVMYAGRRDPETAPATPARDAPQAQTPAQSEKDGAAATSAKPEEPAVQVIDISAPQLYEDYAANEVLADSKYKGQWLRVTGTVVEIGKDFTDDPYVTLVGDNEYRNVRALFRKTMNDRLATLQKGERISLLCIGKGRLVGDAVIDCRSDRVPKYQSPTSTQAAAAPSDTDDTPASEPAAPTTYQTSFDCSKARSTSEQLICQDAELAELDRTTADIFQQAKASATDQKEFAQMARRNWNWRNKNCVDKTCLMKWYADEQRQLQAVIAGPGQSDSQ